MDEEELKGAIARALKGTEDREDAGSGIYLIWWRMHDSAIYLHARDILANVIQQAHQAGRDDVRGYCVYCKQAFLRDNPHRQLCQECSEKEASYMQG